ncbi:Fatty acid transport protein [Operophtera brumata]|uniref:Long-chain-fatty-acid--CoA ligase n=1 Tax=Operophtera brumata TaxID=104452 RepID=A0A0L7LUJ7_OPEBR|nr:Fatty acid transport protein [Operophtera brumata]
MNKTSNNTQKHELKLKDADLEKGAATPSSEIPWSTVIVMLLALGVLVGACSVAWVFQDWQASLLVLIILVLNWSMPDIFHQMVKKHPNKACFLFEDETWTFEQVEQFSLRVSALLKSKGIKRGDTVGVMLNNCPELPAIWVGAARIGAVCPLINTNQTGNTLLHSVNIAKLFEEVSKELNPSIKLFMFTRRPLNTSDSVKVADSPNDFTSMLEATPPAPWTLADGEGFNGKLLMVFMASGVHYLGGLRKSDIIYCPMPLYHSAGGCITMGQSFIFGCTVAIRNKFSASSYFPDCIKFNATLAKPNEPGVFIGKIKPNNPSRAFLGYVDKEASDKKIDMARDLPKYARPVFIRLMISVDMTGTFKLRKVDLQKEGYNPSVVKDRLYYLDLKLDKYVPLGEDEYNKIISGQIRLNCYDCGRALCCRGRCCRVAQPRVIVYYRWYSAPWYIVLSGVPYEMVLRCPEDLQEGSNGPHKLCEDNVGSSEIHGLTYADDDDDEYFFTAVQEVRSQLDPALKLYKFTHRALQPSNDRAPSDDGIQDAINLIETTPPAAWTRADADGFQGKLLYIYTSGTTGLPKAAVISNSSDDVIYCPLPLYHTAGGVISVGQALVLGCTVALKPKFSASQYFSDCAPNTDGTPGAIGFVSRIFPQVYPIAIIKVNQETVDEHGTLDLATLNAALAAELPVYARPVFLRVMPSMDMTGTYKMKKTDLQKEGFDPNLVKKDKLYYLDLKLGKYLPLGVEDYDRIIRCVYLDNNKHCGIVYRLTLFIIIKNVIILNNIYIIIIFQNIV